MICSGYWNCNRGYESKRNFQHKSYLDDDDDDDDDDDKYYYNISSSLSSPQNNLWINLSKIIFKSLEDLIKEYDLCH